MKKLYRKGTAHATPHGVSDRFLSFLPAAALTSSAALSPEDRDVLAYMISSVSHASSNSPRKATRKRAAAACGSQGGVDHLPSFNCDCFRCYKSYWVKWDSSPNCQLIHEIIDALEDRHLEEESKKEKSKRKRRKGKSVKWIACTEPGESKKTEESTTQEDLNFGGSKSAAEGGGEAGGAREYNVGAEGPETGSVRRFVNFLGERIWSVWGGRT